MIKLFNVAYFANLGSHVVYGAALIWAENLQEAIGLGIQYAIEKYPEHYNHQVKAFEVDSGVIELAYNRLKS